jgi:hypothetical protein
VVNDVTSAPQNSASSTEPKRAAGVIIPHTPRWYQRLGAWLVFAAIRLVSATLRYRWHDHREPGLTGPVIYATWHNRLALCLIAYERAAKGKSTAGMAAMVSASRDGAFLSGILERFGVRFVESSRPTSLVGADDVGRARLRPGDHAGWPTRPTLCRAGRRHVPGSSHRLANRSFFLFCEMENRGK